MRAIRSVPAGSWAVWRIALTFSELTDRPHADTRRGDIAVCVCSTGDRALLRASLTAIRANLNAAHSTFLAGSEDAAATAADLDGALAAAAPADVAVVAGGCVVTAGWLDGLRAAADGDPRIATRLGAGIAGRARRHGARCGCRADSEGASVSGPTRRSRPECVLIRRPGLELAGPLDSSLTLAQSLVDLTQRCLGHGLRHVLADDVWSVGVAPTRRTGVDGLLARRYPYLGEWSDELAADSGSPAAMALSAARAVAGRPR